MVENGPFWRTPFDVVYSKGGRCCWNGYGQTGCFGERSRRKPRTEIWEHRKKMTFGRGSDGTKYRMGRLRGCSIVRSYRFANTILAVLNRSRQLRAFGLEVDECNAPRVADRIDATAGIPVLRRNCTGSDARTCFTCRFTSVSCQQATFEKFPFLFRPVWHSAANGTARLKRLAHTPRRSLRGRPPVRTSMKHGKQSRLLATKQCCMSFWSRK